jgi:hypothetical protein
MSFNSHLPKFSADDPYISPKFKLVKCAHAASVSTAIHTYMTTLREQLPELETGVLKLL